MCLYCKALKPLSIGILPVEKVTGQGCDALWRTWVEQNREVIEKEVLGWLDRRSFVSRIMKLRDLPKEKRHIGSLKDLLQ